MIKSDENRPIHIHLKTTNVKVSWKVKKEKNREESTLEKLHKLKLASFNINITFHSNFAVVKKDNSSYVYIIFYDSNFINCTGIRNTSEIKKAVNCFVKLFELNTLKIYNFHIDSISAVSSLGNNIFVNLQNINVTQVKDYIKHITLRSCDTQIFPSCRIKIGHGPCVSIFSTGSIAVVGAKSSSQLTQLMNIIDYVLSTSTNAINYRST